MDGIGLQQGLRFVGHINCDDLERDFLLRQRNMHPLPKRRHPCRQELNFCHSGLVEEYRPVLILFLSLNRTPSRLRQNGVVKLTSWLAAAMNKTPSEDINLLTNWSRLHIQLNISPKQVSFQNKTNRKCRRKVQILLLCAAAPFVRELRKQQIMPCL